MLHISCICFKNKFYQIIRSGKFLSFYKYVLSKWIIEESHGFLHLIV